jgi:simple sugar transport system ATP-binding protein
MPALSLHAISKHFGAVQALSGVDFAVAPGSVHALLGENGAGKSTLMHIAYGMLAADAGEIRVRGERALIRSPRDARRLGIGMVHQHFASVESMTVQENIELVTGEREGRREKGEATTSTAFTSRFSLLASHSLDPDACVETLSVAQKQRLEIVKALATGARILLLDEPTAVLAPPEIDELLPTLRRFADDGGSVVLITHKLREVLAVADRVTVVRQGRVVLEGPVAGQTETGLAAAMVGEQEGRREKGEATATPGGTSRFSLLASRSPAVRGPGFEVWAGEIVGMAAVEGNGQRELLRAVAGIAPRPDVRVEGTVAFVPEDRAAEGLVPDLSLTENIVLGLGADAPWIHGPLVDWSAARRRTAELMAQHDVRAAGPDAAAHSLSGGNQQKVIMARAFDRHPEVLVAENPTRGLDIRATGEVHRRLREAAASGMAVLVWSSDLDEVLELADRVLVVHGGVVREAPRDADRGQVGRMMLGLTGGER